MKFWVSAILILVLVVLIRNRDNAEVDIVAEVTEVEMPEEPELSIDQDSLLRIQALEAALSTFAKGNVFDQDQSVVHHLSGPGENRTEVRLDYGFIISNTQRHLQLTRQYNGQTEQLFYSIKEGEIKPIGQVKWHAPKSAILKDVNGDGLKDIVSRESRSWTIHPYDQENDVFASAVQLQNPCFSPQEQLVRFYELIGQDTLFYKMKWDKYALTPVEFIYPHPDNAFWKLKATERKDSVSPDNASTLWYLPKEYRSVATCVEASVQ
jgi:hypothetical protein